MCHLQLFLVLKEWAPGRARLMGGGNVGSVNCRGDQRDVSVNSSDKM